MFVFQTGPAVYSPASAPAVKKDTAEFQASVLMADQNKPILTTARFKQLSAAVNKVKLSADEKDMLAHPENWCGRPSSKREVQAWHLYNEQHPDNFDIATTDPKLLAKTGGIAITPDEFDAFISRISNKAKLAQMEQPPEAQSNVVSKKRLQQLDTAVRKVKLTAEEEDALAHPENWCGAPASRREAQIRHIFSEQHPDNMDIPVTDPELLAKTGGQPMTLDEMDALISKISSKAIRTEQPSEAQSNVVSKKRLKALSAAVSKVKLTTYEQRSVGQWCGGPNTVGQAKLEKFFKSQAKVGGRAMTQEEYGLLMEQETPAIYAAAAGRAARRSSDPASEDLMKIGGPGGRTVLGVLKAKVLQVAREDGIQISDADAAKAAYQIYAAEKGGERLAVVKKDGQVSKNFTQVKAGDEVRLGSDALEAHLIVRDYLLEGKSKQGDTASD